MEELEPMEPRAYLKDYRKRAGLTLKGAFERGAATPQSINRWETGHSSPSVTELLKLAAAYSIHPSEFFRAPGEAEFHAWDDDAIEAMAKVADVHPIAYRWMKGDFSNIEKAKTLTRILQVLERLPPAQLEHWTKHGEDYPLNEPHRGKTD
jgi:DNA-binding XRE family transcriptional regulator